jgi:murein DD-endopeptidase MepM/ murein hydrolase activator NlpD
MTDKSFMRLMNPVPGSGWNENGGYDGDSGLDILVPAGTPCICAADGVVEYAELGHTTWKEDTFYGNNTYDPPHSVRIRLDKPITSNGKTYYLIWYTHLYKVDPSILDKFDVPIQAGDPIGLTGIGNRVPHLHFGVIQDREQTVCMPHQDIAELIWGSGSADHPRLTNGAHGMAVRNVQRILTALAKRHDQRSLDPEGIDGDFGDNTERAVKAFQTIKGLAVTGVVDEPTWNALEHGQ